MLGLDVRWQQRFQNYTRALSLLSSALKHGLHGLNDLEKDGVVQRFEYTVELAWKVLKDFLHYSGVQFSSVTPKSVIKEGFAARILPAGQIWIDMLDSRNLLSHTYNEALLNELSQDIEVRYLPALQELHGFLAKQGP